VLSWPEAAGTGPQLGWGSVLIVLACVSWGIDNNLTRKLSAADPLQIAMIKGLAAGTVNLALGLARGAPVPGLTTLAAAAAVGFFGYGVSLVLFVLGLRHLGAARTGARSFCTSIRTIRTSTTATSTSTRERTKRPEPGSPK
jgi:drug/metabolite transporter (DMT)-like permease